MNHPNRYSVFFLAILLFASFKAHAKPGEFLVKVKNDFFMKNKNLKNASTIFGSSIKRIHEELGILVLLRPLVELESASLKWLSRYSDVERVEPNLEYRISATPNDPMIGLQWGMINTGAQDHEGQVGRAGIDINTSKAWEIETGKSSTIIAVIDTGINTKDLNLTDNLWINPEEAQGKEGVDDDQNGVVDDVYGAQFIDGVATGNNMDDHGHGSHCAGVIGAKGNDGRGITGVNWRTSIMGVKFLNESGSGTLEDAILAIHYAAKMGAKILSNSWGGGGYSELLKQEIEKANSEGVLFVAAAGNDQKDNDDSPTFPASYNLPNVIAVAAIDNGGQLASFSNYGEKTVHIGAPGVNIYSTYLENSYEFMSGTSMATPFVSGVAGLIYSHFEELSPINIKDRILKFSRPLISLRKRTVSGGMVDAYSALRGVVPEPNPEDIESWKYIEIHIQTPHPYPSLAHETYNVEVPEAKEFALLFDQFQVEKRWDQLQVYDQTGILVQTLTGPQQDFFSKVIKGNKAKLIFTSDDNVELNGFSISRIYYR